MLASLSLRVRIFLFFCLLAMGGMTLAAAALAFGWSRSVEPLPTSPFVTAAVLFAFVNTGFVLAIWLLFDENIAKPIYRLSAQLRVRAHLRVEGDMDTMDARHLGDLAHAANALSRTIGSALTYSADHVVAETERLQQESERLTALLSEIPIATIVLNSAHEIVLYDSQAADLLAQIAVPRLKAPLSDYFEVSGLDDVLQDGSEQALHLRPLLGGPNLQARVKPLADGGCMIMVDQTDIPSRPAPARPLTYDFDLLNPQPVPNLHETPLNDLCFVAFDTETTGLSVEKDEIIQIGASRIVNGRIVAGEHLDLFVNPGRAIPPASTKIHGIFDADVANAPGIAVAGRSLYEFAKEAVLVAHNAPFDIGLLRKREDDMDVSWTHPVLDTVLLSAIVFGITEDHTLDALCARLSVEIDPALRHTALGDAQATAQALVKLLPLLKGRGYGTLGELLSQTRKYSRLLRDMNG